MTDILLLIVSFIIAAVTFALLARKMRDNCIP